MRRLLLAIAVLFVVSGSALAGNMDTAEDVLLDQDRLNSEQADRANAALQKQIDNLDRMNQSNEPDRYEAEDLDHARAMWDARGLR